MVFFVFIGAFVAAISRCATFIPFAHELADPVQDACPEPTVMSSVVIPPLLREGESAGGPEEIMEKWQKGVEGLGEGIQWCEDVNWRKNDQWHQAITQKKQGFRFSVRLEERCKTFLFENESSDCKDFLSICAQRKVVWGDGTEPFVSFKGQLAGRPVSANLWSRCEEGKYTLVWKNGDEIKEYAINPIRKKAFCHYSYGSGFDGSTSPVFLDRKHSVRLHFPDERRPDLTWHVLELTVKHDNLCSVEFDVAGVCAKSGEWTLGHGVQQAPIYTPFSGLGVCVWSNGGVVADVYTQATEKCVMILKKIERDNATMELCAPKKVEWTNAEQMLLVCRYAVRAFSRCLRFSVVGKMFEAEGRSQCAIVMRNLYTGNDTKLMEFSQEGVVTTSAKAHFELSECEGACLGAARCSITLPDESVFICGLFREGVAFSHKGHYDYQELSLVTTRQREFQETIYRKTKRAPR